MAASAGSARNAMARILSSRSACVRAKTAHLEKSRLPKWPARPSFGGGAKAMPDKPHLLCKPCLPREATQDEICLFCCPVARTARIVVGMGRPAGLRDKHAFPAGPRGGTRYRWFRSCEDRLPAERRSPKCAVRIVSRPGCFQGNAYPMLELPCQWQSEDHGRCHAGHTYSDQTGLRNLPQHPVIYRGSLQPYGCHARHLLHLSQRQHGQGQAEHAYCDDGRLRHVPQNQRVDPCQFQSQRSYPR